jgi:hypothetical protein
LGWPSGDKRGGGLWGQKPEIEPPGLDLRCAIGNGAGGRQGSLTCGVGQGVGSGWGGRLATQAGNRALGQKPEFEPPGLDSGCAIGNGDGGRWSGLTGSG